MGGYDANNEQEFGERCTLETGFGAMLTVKFNTAKKVEKFPQNYLSLV